MTEPAFSLADGRASARPRDPAFYQNPYAFYSALHLGTPTFLWEDYGHWCFTGFKEVNALLRDRRFGREILHVATREELVQRATDVLNLVAAGVLTVRIDEAFPLERAADAHRRLEARGTTGKLLITIPA